VVLPTYNESENIVRLISEIHASAPDAHILVVDDGSPDGTGDMVLSLTLSDDRVHLLQRSHKLGLGTAYVAGFRAGIDEGFDFIVTMDADFSHDPRHLPSVLSAAAQQERELAVGSRYVRGGAIVGWPFRRRVLSRGANTLARLLLGLRTRDCTGGYRCYTRQALRALGIDAIVSHGYSALIEILYKSERAGIVTTEVPITFVDRVEGRSKISRSEIYRGVRTVLTLAFFGLASRTKIQPAVVGTELSIGERLLTEADELAPVR